MRSCAIYTRTAVRKPESEIEAQRAACEAYVQRQPGWRVLAERYDDNGQSGLKLDRPGLRRLLADVDAGRIRVVVVVRPDRLSRSWLDIELLLRHFASKGVELVWIEGEP